MQDYAQYDGLGLGELVARKDVSPGELVEAAIARAEALNPLLNAIVFKAYDQAREAVKESLPGPFRGVPMLLKDMGAAARGMPTRMGSRIMPAMPSPHDSTLVARFRAAGLIPLGKTNVPEFGILPTTEPVLYGAAHNPWNLFHSTGGSSGGSAAAVAAGIVPIAHATDGGGSIRIPASCNGLVGLKVSRGRVTQGPDATDRMLGLSVDNAVTRSVRDTACVLDHICAPDYGDPYFALPPEGSYLDGIARPPQRLRIAVAARHVDGTAFQPDIDAAIQKTIKLCEALGHSVEEASPPLDNETLIKAFMTLWATGTAYAVELLSKMTGQTPSLDNLEGITLSLYERGREIAATQQIWAQQLLLMHARTAAKFHETYDLWLTPVLAAAPVTLGKIDVGERDLEKAFAPVVGYAPFTAMQNATGQPAISLPLHWTAEGLPVGVQFVARSGNEMLLLKIAAQLEQAAPWFHRRPKIANAG